jgi:transposase-like protein
MDLFRLAGLDELSQRLEGDREVLCGPKGRWQADRQAYRHGHDEGCLVLGGRKIRLAKPRVRSVKGEELELPHWQQFAQEDPLDDRIFEQLVVGVSTRSYPRSLELSGDLEDVATSRSSVSRRFVAQTSRRVEEFLSRPLDVYTLPVVMVDGTGFGDHVIVVALGIDTDGRKHVLGVAEGSTESEAVGRELFRNLIGRGLVVERARLFVIDGGKGLRKAIRTTFGNWALVQRCRQHKRKNVADHLPKSRRPWVKAVMNRAWKAETKKQGQKKLEELVDQLATDHPGAAASLREGLEETLTLTALGLVKGPLLQTLCTTNPIENLQGTLKKIARNVKRWRGGSMALRWAVSALMEAEKKFRRVRGYRELPKLIATIEAKVNEGSLDSKRRVA